MFKPRVGDTVYANPIAPFDEIISSDVPYVFSGEVLIQDLMRNSVDVYNEVYSPMNISKDIFNSDKEDNITIITLSRGGGGSFSLPVRYVVFGEHSDMEYSIQGIGFKIDKLPVDYDLDPLVEELKDIVIKTLGITPAVTTATLSSNVRIKISDHNFFESERAGIINGYTSFVEERAKLMQRIEELESDKVKLISKIKG